MAYLSNYSANSQYVVKAFSALFGAGVTGDLIASGDTILTASTSKTALVNVLLNNSVVLNSFPLYGANITDTAFVGALLDNMTKGSGVDATTLTNWKAAVTAALPSYPSRAAAVATLIDAVTSYSGTDTSLIALKTVIDNRAEVGAYAAQNGATTFSTLSALQAQTASVDTTAASVTAAQAGATTGSTFTLTANIDNIVGTAGNDIVIADNSGSTKTATAGDQVDGGAGTDTLKFYADAAVNISAQVLPQIKNVEVLYVKGGIAADGTTLDVSTIAGLTNVELDTPAAALVNGKNFTVKTTDSQKVALDNVNTATTGTSKVTLTNATDLTLNGVGASTTDDGVVQIDIANTLATAAAIHASGAASKVTLLNGSGKLEKLTIDGDKNLTVTTSLDLKSIDASTATGNVSANVAGATSVAAFAFNGGKGNDKLTLDKTDLQALTSGAQLVGGDGKDTLAISDAAYTFVTKDYAAINAAKGFEVLAFNGTLDASALTSIKEFAVSTGTNVISKVATGSTLDILAATTKTTVSGDVGVKDLVVNIGSATATSATVNAALDITGLTEVTINANTKAGVTGATHKVGTLTHSDNSTFTIKGNGDFEIALGSATSTGSKVDGSASTGKLTITGGTVSLDQTKASLADVLIGGSGNDTIKASVNGGTLTGNGGNDKFDVSAAKAATGATSSSLEIPVTKITDFTKGDSIQFNASGAVLEKIDLSSVAAGKTDAEIIDFIAKASTTAVNDVVWGVYNGNTYVFNEVATAGAITANDVAVKLVGALDLSTSSIASGLVTFA